MSLTSKGAGVVSAQSRAAEDAVVIPEEIETAIDAFGAVEFNLGVELERGDLDTSSKVEDAVLEAEGTLKRLIAAALATPPSDPAPVSGQPAPVVPDEAQALADRLRAWSENDPDPDYFFGDGDDTVFSMMQRDCAAASEALLAATPSRRADTPLGGGGVVPDGWRLVPVEPTDAMMDAAGKFLEDGLDRGLAGGEGPHLADIWRAYLAAAPAAPEPAAGGEREIGGSLVGPVAWVVPGDDTADANGCIDARCTRDGEFTRPLYALSTPSEAGAAGEGLSQAARDVLAERRRQVEVKGWTTENDDLQQSGELARAAAAYARHAGTDEDGRQINSGFSPEDLWTFAFNSYHPWRPSDPRRDLVKAGALILAELERLDRAALPPTNPRADAPVGGA